MIKTGGGKFDPQERPKYFLAASTSHVFVVEKHKDILIAINEIQSPKTRELFEQALEQGNVFIDSGIYNLTNEHKRKHGTTMDEALALAPEEISGFDKLFESYVEIVKKYEEKAWGYIELDQGGRDNKIRTRQKLEELGLRPIPVYHPLNDGWDYFDELAQNYDRICFGNVVQLRGEDRKKLIATAWERHKKYPELWIHLLGYQPDELLFALPSDSADASSWCSGIRWGSIPEKACGRRLGLLERSYVYELSNEDSMNQSIEMQAIIASMNGRNWKNYLEEIESHGTERYK
jgi:hypothetical protein